jgi:hypothetical protein
LTIVQRNINVLLQSLVAAIPSLGVSSLDLTAPLARFFLRRQALAFPTFNILNLPRDLFQKAGSGFCM